MNNKQRLIALILLFIMIISSAFLVPSGNISESELDKVLEDMENDESAFNILNLFFASANAEEKEFTPLEYSLEVGGRTPIKANFTEDGYEDESISLKLETIERDGVVYRVARIKISHPSQLRTGIAGSAKNLRYAYISDMAKKVNAIIAINGDNMANDKAKTSFEYRNSVKIRAKYSNTKDMLIIDENGDFKLFMGKEKEKEVEAYLSEGHQIIQALTFGPALVKDGEVIKINDKYGYNAGGKEPRMAIGQTDTLSYILVLAEGRLKNSEGVTQQELANIMQEFGAVQAFNLDGGNSATMVYNDGYYQVRSKGNERSQSDFIYFASLVEDGE